MKKPPKRETQVIILTEDVAIQMLGSSDRLYCGTDRRGQDHWCYRQPNEDLRAWCARALDIQARYISLGDPLQML